MHWKRQGGITFWQAGRFGGSLYRKRFTLAQDARRYIQRERIKDRLIEWGIYLNMGLLLILAVQRWILTYY